MDLRSLLVVIRIEGKLDRNFLFAVNKKGSTQFVKLHYNLRGDKAAALASASCKFVRCTDCGDLLYFEGSHLS